MNIAYPVRLLDMQREEILALSGKLPEWQREMVARKLAMIWKVYVLMGIFLSGPGKEAGEFCVQTIRSSQTSLRTDVERVVAGGEWREKEYPVELLGR